MASFKESLYWTAQCNRAKLRAVGKALKLGPECVHMCVCLCLCARRVVRRLLFNNRVRSKRRAKRQAHKHHQATSAGDLAATAAPAADGGVAARLADSTNGLEPQQEAARGFLGGELSAGSSRQLLLFSF